MTTTAEYHASRAVKTKGWQSYSTIQIAAGALSVLRVVSGPPYLEVPRVCRSRGRWHIISAHGRTRAAADRRYYISLQGMGCLHRYIVIPVATSILKSLYILVLVVRMYTRTSKDIGIQVFTSEPYRARILSSRRRSRGDDINKYITAPGRYVRVLPVSMFKSPIIEILYYYPYLLSHPFFY